MNATPEQIAAGLDRTQRGLLDDLCGCPGLFGGEYIFEGAPLSHLPKALVERTFEGSAGFLLGAAKARPTPLGLAVQRILKGEG